MYRLVGKQKSNDLAINNDRQNSSRWIRKTEREREKAREGIKKKRLSAAAVNNEWNRIFKTLCGRHRMIYE